MRGVNFTTPHVLLLGVCLLIGGAAPVHGQSAPICEFRCDDVDDNGQWKHRFSELSGAFYDCFPGGCHLDLLSGTCFASPHEPCEPGQHEQQDEDVLILSLESFGETILPRLSRGEGAVLAGLLERAPGVRIALNRSRNAVQLLGCAGVIAHLPLSSLDRSFPSG